MLSSGIHVLLVEQKRHIFFFISSELTHHYSVSSICSIPYCHWLQSLGPQHHFIDRFVFLFLLLYERDRRDCIDSRRQRAKEFQRNTYPLVRSNIPPRAALDCVWNLLAVSLSWLHNCCRPLPTSLKLKQKQSIIVRIPPHDIF